jgi:hypothetical protein
MISCKKMKPVSLNDPTNIPAPVPAPDTKTFLMTNTWKITGITVSPAYNGTTDIYGGLEYCEKDDQYHFNANDILVMNEITKCDPSDADTTTGTWTYNDSSKILRLIYAYPGASYDLEFLVIEVAGNYFRSKLGFTENGTSYYWTYTFQKQ